jgi:stearoyl-CoA desaturase (Delta-9 desaturase)
MMNTKVLSHARFSAANRVHAVLMLVLGNGGIVAAAALTCFGIAPARADLAIGLAYTVVISIGSAIGFHRLLSHRSFETSGPMRAIFAALGSMTMQGPPVFWVALHRRHHACSDGSGDPHSPHVLADGTVHASRLSGLLHAYVGWTFAHEIPNPAFYTPDLLRDRWVMRVNRQYAFWVVIGLTLPALTGFALSHTLLGACTGLVWGGLIRLWFWHQMTWYITSFSHTHGGRDFVSSDQSRNSGWMALPTFGESWHNTHHAFPAAAVLNAQWWQLDLTGATILALERLGLVWQVRRLRTTPRPAANVSATEQSR